MAIVNAARLAAALLDRCSAFCSWPAAAGPAEAGGSTAAADRDGGQAGAAHGRRSGRICRPLRRRRCGRNTRARLAATCPRSISPTGSWSRRATFSSPSTGGRSRSRSNRCAPISRRRAPISLSPRPISRAAQELVRNKTMTEQIFDQRKQAKRVAEAVGRGAGGDGRIRPSSTSTNIPNLRAPIDGRIGDRRVSVGNLVTGGIGCNTTLLATIVSVDPIRFEFTFDEASYLRYQRFAGAAGKMANADSGIAVTLKLIDEAGFRAHRSDGLRRQRHRQILGHDPRPRRLCQPGRTLYPRHVRPHPRARFAAAHHVACSRRSASAPSSRANTCWWSTTATRSARNM